MEWIIPTAIWRDDLPKNTQNYWWLRSPYTDFDNLAWVVTSSGVVSGDFNGNVYFSYGRIYFRRTRVGTLVLILSTRLASSAATAATVSSIPTGSLNRRTRTHTTSTMRGMCGRVAISATSVAAVPTVFGVNRLPKNIGGFARRSRATTTVRGL